MTWPAYEIYDLPFDDAHVANVMNLNLSPAGTRNYNALAAALENLPPEELTRDCKFYIEFAKAGDTAGLKSGFTNIPELIAASIMHKVIALEDAHPKKVAGLIPAGTAELDTLVQGLVAHSKRHGKPLGIMLLEDKQLFDPHWDLELLKNHPKLLKPVQAQLFPPEPKPSFFDRFKRDEPSVKRLAKEAEGIHWNNAGKLAVGAAVVGGIAYAVNESLKPKKLAFATADVGMGMMGPASMQQQSWTMQVQQPSASFGSYLG